MDKAAPRLPNFNHVEDPSEAKHWLVRRQPRYSKLKKQSNNFNYERTLFMFSFSLSRPLNSTLVNKVDEVFRNRWRTLLSVDEMVDKECAHRIFSRILNCYLSNSSSGFTNFLYRFLYFCWVLGHFSKPTIWQMRLTRAR